MKRRALIIFNLLLGLLAPWAIGDAIAEEMNPVDAQAIHFVIQSQLDAFAEDDAAKAFGFATSSTRILIGSADDFLRLIKNEYPVIYRNRLALFAVPELVDGQALQIVRLTDSDNFVWVAIYSMQQESDGTWKIDGCKLIETASVST
ncbi:MAG: hypothetical protein JWQ21_1364 [Herminiimonas sp.]|jgi:hypothetical protein|nr:hypothetical protein [Herminiimonas sp.]